jgi:hypothetical protein
VPHLIAKIHQVTAQHIDRNKRPEVADVPVVIYGRAARIHSHGVAVERLEFFKGSTEGISELEHVLQ